MDKFEVVGTTIGKLLGGEELRKKNIAIRLDIYDQLLDMKRGKDTFSDVIERLVLNWKGQK